MLSSVVALICSTQRGAEIGQRPGVLDRGLRARKRCAGIVEQRDGALVVVNDRECAQGDAEGARRRPAPTQGKFSLGELDSAAALSQRGEADRRLRAPGRHARIVQTPFFETLARSKKVVDRASGITELQTQASARLEQQRALVPGRGVGELKKTFELGSGLGRLSAGEQCLDHHRQRVRLPRLPVVQAHNVERGASIGLGVYESAATSVQQRPLAGRADEPGRRAGRYGARQRLIQVVLRC